MNSTLSKIAAVVALVSVSYATVGGNAEDEFPLRKKYPHLTTISTEAFASLPDPIIVDARNLVEFDVIHIKDATNLLVGDMKKADLSSLRAANPDAALVFYCNGTTCSKSYKAADKASIWGFEDVHVYDAGVFAWGQAHADRTIFFDEEYSQKELDKLLLSKEEFNKSCLAPEAFVEAIGSGEYKIFDVRDKTERQEFPLKVPGVARVSMDQLVEMIAKGAFEGNKMLFLDNVGKQVRWLQYHLKRAGINDYYFLKGGILQWQEDGFSNRGER